MYIDIRQLYAISYRSSKRILFSRCFLDLKKVLKVDEYIDEIKSIYLEGPNVNMVKTLWSGLTFLLIYT